MIRKIVLFIIITLFAINFCGQSLGYVRPTSLSSLSSDFGPRYYLPNPWHKGIDYAVGQGTMVEAIEPGNISKIEKSSVDYGNRVIIKNGNRTFGYCHLYEGKTGGWKIKTHAGVNILVFYDSSGNVAKVLASQNDLPHTYEGVSATSYINEGEYFARSGNTGLGTGAHLHVGLNDGFNDNPYLYIPYNNSDSPQIEITSPPSNAKISGNTFIRAKMNTVGDYDLNKVRLFIGSVNDTPLRAFNYGGRTDEVEYNTNVVFNRNANGVHPIDANGNVYVVDCDNHRVLKYDKDGNIKYFDRILVDLKDAANFVTYRDVIQRSHLSGTEWRSFWYKSNQINDLFIVKNDFPDTQTPYAYHANSGNLGNGDGQLAFPTSAAVDSIGSIYVADTGNNRIQKFGADGSFVLKFGEGILKSPKGIDVDSYGSVFVADSGNQRIVQFNSIGEFVKEYKSEDYAINPQKIKVKDGKIYIADASSNKPLVWNVGGELANVRVSEPWFSPNGDSKKNNIRISYTLSQPADVTIQLIPKANRESRTMPKFHPESVDIKYIGKGYLKLQEVN